MSENVMINALFFGALKTYMVRYQTVGNDIWWSNYDIKMRSVYSEDGRFSKRMALNDWETFNHGNDGHEKDNDVVVRILIADRAQWWQLPSSEKVTKYDPKETCFALGRCCAEEVYCHFAGAHFVTNSDGKVPLESITGHRSLAVTGEQSQRFFSSLETENELVLPMDSLSLAEQAPIAGAFATVTADIYGYSIEKAYGLIPLIGDREQQAFRFWS